VPWSPPADYLKEVFLPTMSGMGVRVKMEILMRGFYPIGGGTLDVTVEPLRTPLRPFRIEKRGELKQLSIVSMAAHLPLSIAKRQLDRAMARLAEHEFEARGESLEVESPGKGTFCFILAAFENVRAGFSSLGEIGKRAENVADEAVEAFLRFWSGRGALDRHLSDQVALPMALADGESEVTVSKVTEHLKTNIWVIEQFLPVKFHLVEDPALGGGSLRVTGAALRAAKGGQRL
jgi:RNA 3'-terminal phosphate cyclase (ATP)